LRGRSVRWCTHGLAARQGSTRSSNRWREHDRSGTWCIQRPGRPGPGGGLPPVGLKASAPFGASGVVVFNATPAAGRTMAEIQGRAPRRPVHPRMGMSRIPRKGRPPVEWGGPKTVMLPASGHRGPFSAQVAFRCEHRRVTREEGEAASAQRRRKRPMARGAAGSRTMNALRGFGPSSPGRIGPLEGPGGWVETQAGTT